MESAGQYNSTNLILPKIFQNGRYASSSLAQWMVSLKNAIATPLIGKAAAILPTGKAAAILPTGKIIVIRHMNVTENMQGKQSFPFKQSGSPMPTELF